VKRAFVVRLGDATSPADVSAAFARHGVDVVEFDVADDGVRARVADASEAAVHAAAAEFDEAPLVVPLGAVDSPAFAAVRG
jgi:hypothetical protein